jgi:hypothetical protein
MNPGTLVNTYHVHTSKGLVGNGIHYSFSFVEGHTVLITEKKCYSCTNTKLNNLTFAGLYNIRYLIDKSTSTAKDTKGNGKRDHKKALVR